MVRYLTEKLNKADLLDVTDIIILSDHGMDTYRFHPENFDGDIIDLYRFIGKESFDMYGQSPVLQIIARPGHNQTELCEKLKLAAALNGNYNVYTNNDLKTKKANWHYYNEQRVGPCTAVSNPGFVFQDKRDELKKYHDLEKCKYCVHSFVCLRIVFAVFSFIFCHIPRRCFILVVPGELFGAHGYDNLAPAMQAVFIANGHRFRRGIEIPFLQNIDLYHLFARLLNIHKFVPDLHIDGVDRPELWMQMLNENVLKID